MKSIEKKQFMWLLRVRPLLLIGKEIIHKEKTAKILDVSVSGDFMFLELAPGNREWEPADSIGDNVIIDTNDFPMNKGKPFTVASLTSSMDTLEKLIGQPSIENSKPLFMIAEALNKEMLELKLKFEAKTQLSPEAVAIVDDYVRQTGMTRFEALKLLLVHSKPPKKRGRKKKKL